MKTTIAMTKYPKIETLAAYKTAVARLSNLIDRNPPLQSRLWVEMTNLYSSTKGYEKAHPKVVACKANAKRRKRKVRPAAEKGVGVHPILAMRAFQGAFQFRGVERTGPLLVAVVTAAALGDDYAEKAYRRQKAATAVAVADRFALDQSTLQPMALADRAPNARRVAEWANAVTGFLGEVVAVAVRAMEVVAIADRRHGRATSGTVHECSLFRYSVSLIESLSLASLPRKRGE